MTTTSQTPETDNHTECSDNQRLSWEAYLAYIPIFCLYPWSIRNRKPEIAEHALQGMILFIIELFLLLVAIPIVYKVIWLCVVVLVILGLVSVINNRTYRLPLLADLFDRLSLKKSSTED